MHSYYLVIVSPMQLVGTDGEEKAQLGPRITVIARCGWVVPGTSKALKWPKVK